MPDLSRLHAELAALDAKVSALVAAAVPADQAAIDEATTRVSALSAKVQKSTPVAAPQPDKGYGR